MHGAPCQRVGQEPTQYSSQFEPSVVFQAMDEPVDGWSVVKQRHRACESGWSALAGAAHTGDPIAGVHRCRATPAGTPQARQGGITRCAEVTPAIDTRCAQQASAGEQPVLYTGEPLDEPVGDVSPDRCSHLLFVRPGPGRARRGTDAGPVIRT